MQLKCVAAALILFLCTACSSVKVLPVATSTGSINPEELSITEALGDVTFTVKHDELSVAPYQIIDNITSFHVNIDNQSDKSISYPPKAFLLKDGQGRQYRSIAPARVKEIVSKDTVYLIPYPYVGYYYLEDQAMVSYADTFSSNMPFYAEYHPQDIFTRSLTEEPILKGSKVAGVIYFVADLENTEFAELLVFSGGEASGEPLARFSFKIEK